MSWHDEVINVIKMIQPKIVRKSHLRGCGKGCTCLYQIRILFYGRKSTESTNVYNGKVRKWQGSMWCTNMDGNARRNTYKMWMHLPFWSGTCARVRGLSSPPSSSSLVGLDNFKDYVTNLRSLLNRNWNWLPFQPLPHQRESFLLQGPRHLPRFINQLVQHTVIKHQ